MNRGPAHFMAGPPRKTIHAVIPQIQIRLVNLRRESNSRPTEPAPNTASEAGSGVATCVSDRLLNVAGA